MPWIRTLLANGVEANELPLHNPRERIDLKLIFNDFGQHNKISDVKILQIQIYYTEKNARSFRFDY